MAKSFAVPSDTDLAAEMKNILDAYVKKANELRDRDMIVSFQITNGTDGQPVKIAALSIIRNVLEIKPAAPAAQ